MLKFLYYGSIPSIIFIGNQWYWFILIGIFSKPYSPILLGVWHWLNGTEPNTNDMYAL